MRFPKIHGYQILSLLGKGGFSMVYEALDMNSGFKVAVKVLDKKLFKKQIVKQKFIAEANYYLYLDHPNIAKLRDMVVTEEAIYLIMDFIDGIGLDVYISKVTGPIPELTSKEYILQLLDAIEYAHNRDVIHLDIKPGNLKITYKAKLFVLDFGISQTKSEIASGKYLTGGSPIYMSPEQMGNKLIDKRSDIYSIGLTLYQMVTGRLPYPANISKQNLSQLIKSEYPVDPQHHYPLISDKMKRIINIAIRKNPDERYQDCIEFRNDLMKEIVN
jgi:serine/threonine protein kinase